MAIYRGAGGAGDSNTDATLLEVTEQAVIATTKASDAAASASAAATSETNAATSATASASSATAAASAASGVSASATAAANSATAAANSATAAATAETNAETAETNAETAESNASTSATTATTKAAEAATSATSASTSASTATTKASEASTSASSASTSATTATTKASEATTSATSASTSASTATTKASEAATSATNAATSATAAAASAASIGTDPSFNSVTITGTTALKLPVGTTAQRPTPTTGQFRYNSTLGEFEGYTTEWGSVGGGSADISLNQFTGDGSDTTFTLSGLAAENNTFVYIDGVYQSKDNYSVSAADPAVLTFSTAPPNTTAIEVMSAAISVSNIGTPSDNTVTTAKIVDGAVTPAKIASGDFNFAKSDQTNGATLSITNSFSGGGWDAGDILGSLNFRTDDTSTTQPIRGQIKVFEDSASGTTYPNRNAMSFSTGLNNDLTERMRIASDGIEISNGAIALKNAGTQSKIDFYCESSNAHYTRIQAAPHSSYTGNVVLTLPASDGDAGQFLKTDGSGVMSWAASGGDTVTYGTFTPTVNSGTVTAVGSWMRIGDMVTVTFKCTSFSDTSSSTQVQVVLPFTCKSGTDYSAHGVAINNKVFGSNNEVFEITGGTALASMYYKQSSSSASLANAPHSYINDSSSYVKSTLTYRVA